MASARLHADAQPTNRRSSKRRLGVLALALTAGSGAFAIAAGPASADQFSQIRQCESGGNYSTNTGNGYYGAYQFSQSTWNSLGYSGLPSDASPAQQDAAAQQLAARSGYGQWPVCGAGGGSYSAPTTSTYSAPAPSYQAPASRSYARPTTPTVSKPTVWPLLNTSMAGQYNKTVEDFQKAMALRGYHLKIDGSYGDETQKIAKDFQKDSGLQVDGVVGPTTWNAAFAHGGVRK